MVRHLPPLNALRAFEAAARHLSFTRAAEELHVTPAAVSHQVKALEDQLGIRLFRRLVRGLVLTDAGRAYLPGLTEGLDALARATDTLRETGLKGLLTVSALPSLATRWLVPRLAGFGRLYPDIDVAVRADHHVVDFTSEDVDCAIRHGRGRYPGLRTDLLMTEEIFPVCSPKLLEGPRPLRRMEDLRHHTLLHDAVALPHEPWLTWAAWLRAAELTGVNPNRGPSFSDSNMLLQAAVAGQGVALGRTALTIDDLRAGRLVRPLPVSRPADCANYLVAPEATADQPKIAAFRAWLIDLIDRDLGTAGEAGPGAAPGTAKL